jgi:hypothetical protein
MALPKFDYPTAASPTDSVAFSKGNSFPHSITYEANQKLSFSESGKTKAALISGSWRVWRLKFDRISSANYSDLQDFIVNTVEYATNTFQYTDHDSTVYTVRYIPNTFNFVEAAPALYSGTLQIRENI